MNRKTKEAMNKFIYILVRKEDFPYDEEERYVKPFVPEIPSHLCLERSPTSEEKKKARISQFVGVSAEGPCFETELRLIQIYTVTADCEINESKIQRGQQLFQYRFSITSSETDVTESQYDRIFDLSYCSSLESSELRPKIVNRSPTGVYTIAIELDPELPQGVRHNSLTYYTLVCDWLLDGKIPEPMEWFDSKKNKST